jgi:hypothetical protein
MASNAQLVLEVVAKVDQAKAAIDKVAGSTSGFDKMKVAAAGIGAAVATEFGLATHAAMEQQTILAGLETTYRNVGLSAKDAKEGLDQVEATTRRTGQSSDDAAQAYQKLVLATKSSTTAMSDLKVAEDLAAFSHTSVTDASNLLIKAQEGQVRGLKALGIATTDAQGKALPYEQVLKNVTAAVKGQADAYGNTAEGSMARFHEGLQQTQEAIGTALLPAIQVLTGWLARLADFMAQNHAVMAVVVPIVAAFAAVIVTVTVALRIWTAVQTVLDAVLAANPIGLVVVAIAALVAGVVLAYQHVKWFHDAVNVLWSILKSLISWLTANWRLIVGIMLGPIALVLLNLDKFKAILDAIIGALGKVKDAASTAFGWLGKVGGFLGKGLGAIGLSAPSGGGGATVTPVNFVIYATPGDNLPDVVYDALRQYQRRHRRPELANLFGGAR